MDEQSSQFVQVQATNPDGTPMDLTGATVTGGVTAELAYADTAELLPITYDHMLTMVLANKYSVEAFGTITILDNIALL